MPDIITAIKERPILFSGPMVRAILDGRKTQTRRVVKWKPREPGLNLNFSGLELGHYFTGRPASGWVLHSRDGNGCWNDRTWPAHCPHGQSGDRLWVRETWAPNYTGLDRLPPHYRADLPDDRDAALTANHAFGLMQWKPSIHMPRKLCRLVLEITGVRVERLQEISNADITAEGFTSGEGVWAGSMRAAFFQLWDKLNSKRGYSWESNPWVWVLTFKRLEPSHA